MRIIENYSLLWIKSTKEARDFFEKIKSYPNGLLPCYGRFKFHGYIGFIRPNKGGE